MPITNITRVKTIAIEIKPADGNSIVTLYQNNHITVGSELIRGYKIISYNSFIKNLKAYADIKSLPPVDLPEISPEDSETQKTYKALEVEWKSPRKQMNLFISNNQSQWLPVGSQSLLNPSGYPYRIYDLIQIYTDNVAIELGDNSRLGCQIEDVGYDVLIGLDKIIIHGSFVEEIFVESKEPPINIAITADFQNLPTYSESNSLGNNTLISNSFLLGN